MLIENKKGFTLVEVICSLGVFSIIFTCLMSYEVASLNMKKDIRNINNNVIVMENLKNNIIYDMTFIELNTLNAKGMIYINKNNITLDENKMINNAVFTNKKPELSSYMKLTVSSLELNVYKLNLTLYSGEPNDVLELESNFYKGDHK